MARRKQAGTSDGERSWWGVFKAQRASDWIREELEREKWPDEAFDPPGVSRATFYRLDKKGEVPRAVRIGKSRRWRREELRLWLDANCPSRERWEEMIR